MPRLFREIGNGTWWDKARNVGSAWLPVGTLLGDALKGIQTKDGGRLSFYRYDGTENSLCRVATAFASCRSEIKRLDYATIEENVIDEKKFKKEGNPGETADDEVNRWHVEVIELSADEILKLGYTLYENAEFDRMEARDIKTFLVDSATSGILDKNKLNPKLRPKLGV